MFTSAVQVSCGHPPEVADTILSRALLCYWGWPPPGLVALRQSGSMTQAGAVGDWGQGWSVAHLVLPNTTMLPAQSVFILHGFFHL